MKKAALRLFPSAPLCCLAAALFSAAHAAPSNDWASFVNPFVGTENAGNTYPGAVAPFGSVQMTPNLAGNGYYYRNDHMHGFVVAHMSGDGGANEGQVLMTATTGPVKIDRQSTDYSFDHQHESASAGYYQVLMQPWNINAQMTATTRCGFVKFTFPAGQQGNIVLPLSYVNNASISSHVRYVDAQTVEGDVNAESFNGYHLGITVYFVMKFSKPFDKHGTWTNTAIQEGGDHAAQDDRKTIIGFYGSYPAADKPYDVNVRIGVSYVDLAGARANLQAEMPDDDFEKYHAQTREAWNQALGVIETKGGTEDHNRIFYTALYHSLIAPQIADDVDGRYRGFDDKIHQVPEGHKHFYTTFSGWDIYRTLIPLLTIIEPERVQDMAQSLVEEYKQLGYIDRWSQRSRPTAIMNGHPNTLVLVNIWNAGLHGFDVETAYEGMFKQSLPGNIRGYLGDYQLYEEEMHGLTINPDAAVATALEHDLAFAALGNLAKSLGKLEDANYLFGRASQYREMYNPATGFLQRRNREGRWDPGFGGYTEGNKWIYLWFVPHDVQGLVDLLGGDAAFEKRLDEFFNDNHYDSTNEPDLQAPFFYNYIGRPWKTQRIVAETADKAFSDTPGGLSGGNDDLGTMSAWYVLTQLGFYPVDPGIPDLAISTPRFPQATIHLSAPHQGREFVIEAPKAAPENIYIQSATLDGKAVTQPWMPVSWITRGGKWTVDVGPEPNKQWAVLPKDRPYSLSTGYNHFPQNPVVTTLVPTSQQQPQTWSYTTDRPADDWFKPGFSDKDWQTGPAPFGSRSRDNPPRTPWRSNDIWMRRTFTLPEANGQLALSMCHEQGADVYINGVLAVTSPGGSNKSYALFPISAEGVAALHPGENTLAVHVRHEDFESNFADVGIVSVQWPAEEIGAH
jgi:predicted alpha-1,2-mannosidase